MRGDQDIFERAVKEFEEKGWWQEAILLRRFPRTDLNDPLVQGMFVAATTVRDLRRAERIAQRLVTIAPDNPFAHLALCLVRLRQGRLGEAAKAFDHAASLASTFPIHQADRIHWHCLKGKVEAARQLLREARKAFPDRWEVQGAQAHLWLVQGRFEDAVQLLTFLLKRRPYEPSLHALMAEALCHLGQKGRADEHLSHALETLPPLTLSSSDALLKHAFLQRALAKRFKALSPFWKWQRWFLCLPPQRFFLRLGFFWASVASALAVAHIFLPPPFFFLLFTLSLLSCLYTQFADGLVAWSVYRGRSRRDKGNPFSLSKGQNLSLRQGTRERR